jgi:phosphodiesterase/alkaline phosphatase D-like protein
MSLVNEPSPFAFVDNIPLPTIESAMTAEQKYWYNLGHEHGRNLAIPQKTKPLSDEEINDIRYKIEVKEGWELEFARAIEAKVRGEK